MSAPLAIDLFCGLGGWSDGLIAEGWRVVGFDIERHEYGHDRYPGQLVLQDVLTLDGAQFREASLIVASPPCQEFSWMAMPWSRAKRVAAALRGQGDFPEGYKGSRTTADLTRLFDACFRIQREACEAAGRHIPLVVENVRGAQAWVGRARWNYGSFYLWGDVPALMPIVPRRGGVKVKTMGAGWYPPGHPKHVPGLAFNAEAAKATKNPGFRFDGSGRSFQSESVRRINKAWRDKHYDEEPKMATDGTKRPGIGGPRANGKGEDGVKAGAAYRGRCSGWGVAQHTGSKSTARKAASARIAKIPLALARHVAQAWWSQP